MLAEIRAGLPVLLDGTVAPARASRIGAEVVGVAQGKYYEQASRGNVFSLVLTAWSSTISTGNVVAAAAATQPNFCLWNPPGSGKNLSLLKFSVWAVSGTAPVPPVVHSYSVTAPTVTTSVVTPIACNNVGMSAACVAKAVTSAAAGVAITGGSALLYLRAADLSLGAGAITTANLFEPKITEYIDGDIVIPPNTMWVPTWMAQGTTFLGGYSVTWEEIPV